MGADARLFIGLTGASEIALAQACAEQAGIESQIWDGTMTPPPGVPCWLLLDTALPGPNAYEVARSCMALPAVRVLLAVPSDREGEARDLARFLGAEVLPKPISGRLLVSLLSPMGPEEAATSAEDMDGGLLADRILGGKGGSESPESRLVALLSEPATGLFKDAYMRLRLDEECKRAFRFQIPLSAVLLGLEGPGPEVPVELILGVSGRLLGETRDIDSLGHWDQGRLLLLLPGTPDSGARTMLRRILPGLAALLEEHPGWRVFAGAAVFPPAAAGPGSLASEVEVLRAGPETLLAEAEAGLIRAKALAGPGALSGLAGPGD